MVSLKKEYSLAQRGMAEYTYLVGTSVLWMVYIGSVGENPIYDEGGRKWTPGLILPVYMAPRQEGAEQDTGEGTYTEETIELLITPEIWHGRGLPAPDSPNRVNDRFFFESHTYSVNTFQLEGRTAPHLIDIYRVAANQVQDDERVFDAQ